MAETWDLATAAGRHAARDAGLPVPDEDAPVVRKDCERPRTADEGSRVSFCLPWPPSVNHYWRHVGNKVLISREGRAYRKTVRDLLLHQDHRPFEGRIAVRISACPPDHRKRDLDNILKGLLDALAAAGIYRDDSQIDDVYIHRSKYVSGGSIFVSVWPIEEQP